MTTGEGTEESPLVQLATLVLGRDLMLMGVMVERVTVDGLIEGQSRNVDEFHGHRGHHRVVMVSSSPLVLSTDKLTAITERSPSSRARSPPLSVRRRSASPPPRRATRTPSPAARSSARGAPDSSSRLENRSNDDAEREARDREEPGPSQKRSRERSRSRSASVAERKRSPSPVRLENDVRPKSSDAASSSGEPLKAQSPVRPVSPPRRPRSPTPPPVVTVEQEPLLIPSIETNMDVDLPYSPSPSAAASALTDKLSPIGAQLPPRPSSPPTGPRNYVRTPTSMQSPQQPSPIVPARSPITLDGNVPPSLPAIKSHRPPTGPSEKPKVSIPIDWKISRDKETGKMINDDGKKAKLSEVEQEVCSHLRCFA